MIFLSVIHKQLTALLSLNANLSFRFPFPFFYDFQVALIAKLFL